MTFTVCIPYYGPKDKDHDACVDVLKKAKIPVVCMYDFPFIDMARGLLAKRFLEDTDTDILLFIDHDIIFQPRDAIAMCGRLQSSNWDIMGALYSTRKPADGLVGCPGPHVTEMTFYEPGIYPAHFLGMGFTAIKRSVFDVLNESCPEVYCGPLRKVIRTYFMQMLDDSRIIGPKPIYWHGEDISFIVRARIAGLQVAIDTEPRLLHRGKKDYAIEDAAETSSPNANSVKVIWPTERTYL